MADFYRAAPLPASIYARRDALTTLGAAIGAEGATHFRFTVVDDVHPIEGIPPGIYVQGWLIEPEDDSFEFPEGEFPA